VAAVREATSQKAREVAHPQLFRSMLEDKPALYFPVRVAHPPMDQGGKAGGEDDAALLPSFPLEPSPAGIEPAGLQSGQFVAAP
jgi:hypothetical protein